MLVIGNGVKDDGSFVSLRILQYRLCYKNILRFWNHVERDGNNCDHDWYIFDSKNSLFRRILTTRLSIEKVTVTKGTDVEKVGGR